MESFDEFYSFMVYFQSDFFRQVIERVKCIMQGELRVTKFDHRNSHSSLVLAFMMHTTRRVVKIFYSSQFFYYNNKSFAHLDLLLSSILFALSCLISVILC